MTEQSHRPEEPQRLPIRLAMRHQGEWWIAYAARNDTMDDALELGRVLYNAVDASQECREAFLAAFSGVLMAFIRSKIGELADQTVLVEEPAPEAERSGHA